MSKCLICENITHKIIDTQIKYQGSYVYYHVCETCGFTFKDHRFYPNSEEEKSQYDFHQNTFENIGYVNMFKRFIAQAIDPFIKKGKALDFGSGPGPVLATLLKEKGFDTEIYDPYYSPNKDVLSHKYDVITLTEVCEHFHSPISMFEQLISLLKKEGYLVIMTQFIKDPKQFLSWWYRRDSTHVAFYTEQSFKYLAAKYNLDIVYNNHKDSLTLRSR